MSYELRIERSETAIRRDAPRVGFFTDTTTCIGCKACEVACKQWNDLPSDGAVFRKGGSYDHTGSLGAATWRHVRFVEVAQTPPIPDPARNGHHELDLVGMADGSAPLDSWIFMSDVCKHCTNAGCLDACPTGALIRSEFGTVVLQADVCNGCGYCIPSCPFGVVDRDHDDGRAAKCTLCYDRLQDELEPACAKACPTDSIQFGELGELQERAARRVATLHERGVDGAYLYGAGDPDGQQLAGGLGAFFLLTQPPERYGLPAEADSPIQDNVVPATVAATGAGVVAAGAVAAAFAMAKRSDKAPWVGAVAAAAVASDLLATFARRRRGRPRARAEEQIERPAAAPSHAQDEGRP